MLIAYTASVASTDICPKLFVRGGHHLSMTNARQAQQKPVKIDELINIGRLPFTSFRKPGWLSAVSQKKKITRKIDVLCCNDRIK